MSDYAKTTNFTAKDGLSPGDANKKINGSLFDTEFDAIQTAVATKANSASPTFTGTVVMTAPQIQDTSSDHQYVFAVNELAADRTVTLPLLTGNDEFVFKDHAVALTSKTIDLTSNTLQGSKTEFNTALESDTFLMASDLLDEDTMTSNSATAPASQQSIKAYVDAQIAAPGYVDTTGVVNAGEYARFNDSNTLEALTATELKTALSLTVGSDVQAYDADLSAIGALAKTDGNIIVGNGSTWVAESGATARTSLGLAIGTDVQAEISGASLTAATVATGDKVLIQDADASDALKTVTAQSIADLAADTNSYVYLDKADVSTPQASVSFDNTVFDGTYDDYVVRFHNVIPVTDGAEFIMRTSTDNGVSFDNGASDYAYSLHSSTTSAADNIRIATNVGSAANENGMSGAIRISQPSAATYTIITEEGIGGIDSTGAPYNSNTLRCAVRLSAADVDAVQFLFSSGNIESGIFAIYGIKRA